MHRATLAAIAALAVVIGNAVPSANADEGGVRRPRHVVRHVYRDVRPSCPDRYSCGSLYGAYGPYGAAFYGRYYSPPPAYPAACDSVAFPRSPLCPLPWYERLFR
jgi:hypothetical protein